MQDREVANLLVHTHCECVDQGKEKCYGCGLWGIGCIKRLIYSICGIVIMGAVAIELLVKIFN